jgi:hypothetical protein
MIGQRMRRGLVVLALAVGLTAGALVIPVASVPVVQPEPVAAAQACGPACTMNILADLAQTYAPCAAAVTAVIVGVGIPAAKVAKLVAFIQHVKKLGGDFREAVYLLMRVAKGYEQASELAPGLGGLAGAVLGIDQVRRQCN